MIFVLVLLDFNSSYQIQLFTMLSLSNLIYLISKKPIVDPKLYRLELFNECSTLLCSYFFLSLDAVSS